MREQISSTGNFIERANPLQSSVNSTFLDMDDLEKKRLFGQVFTPKWIADLMSHLSIRRYSDKGLDPCFGRGIFLYSIAERLIGLGASLKELRTNISCVEIDPLLYFDTLKAFHKKFSIKPRFSLDSFFEYKPDEKFDFIIMNPPYVRHELLNSELLPPNVRKEEIVKHIPGAYSKYISQRSNLYTYFFLQAASMLADGGILSAITYNSWMSSKYGKYLQRFLLDNFKIRYIIDFDKESFNDALVGSCILVLEKLEGDVRKSERDDNRVCFARLKSNASLAELLSCLQENPTNNQINQVSMVGKNYIKQSELYCEDKWEKYLFLPAFHRELISTKSLTPLHGLASILRGNEMSPLRAYGGSSLSILKNPRLLVGKFKTSECKADILLGKEAERLLKPTGDIIFSYIIRNNKRFYINDAKYFTSDNFHNIKANVDAYALFAILNSSIAKYFIETCGRSQGSGLLKMQVYELKNMLVPDIRKAPIQLVKELSMLGRKLSVSKKPEIILNEIDELVFHFIGKKELLPEVRDAETKMMLNRLKKRSD